MSVHSRKRPSLELEEESPSLTHSNRLIPSDSNIRKGGLKPESQRMFSEKKITDEPNPNKPGTAKSIRSNRSIQFKNSN